MQQSIIDKIPRDLPITDPLLFSLLVIIDAAEFQIRIRGKFDNKHEDLPVFEYAVNTWRVEEDPQDENIKTLYQNILCGYFRDKPIEEDCVKIWGAFPDGEKTSKKHNIDYTAEFEQWRNQCFAHLEQIIAALVEKGEDRDPVTKKRRRLLADIFKWEIQDNIVNYFYVVNKSNLQLYGVGAEFELSSPFKNCCPKIPSNKIQKSFLQSKNFILPD